MKPGLIQFRLVSFFALLAMTSLLSGCWVARSLLESKSSEYERDIEFRGAGSQEAWLQATGGKFNGDLPRN